MSIQSNNPVAKRRILFTCWDFRIGGQSSHTLNFARALLKHGSVSALVAEPFGELQKDFRKNLDEVIVLRRGLETRKGYVHRLARIIQVLKFDIVINNAVPCVQAAMPLLPPEIVRLSVVHSVLENEILLGLANGRWVDRVVAVSDNVRQALERRNARGVKLATIPVGLESPKNERRRPMASSPLRLIFVGRIAPEKNLPGLLNVLSCLYKLSVPFSMTVVGDGKELPAFRSLVRDSVFAEQVHFLGVRSPEDVDRLLEEHDFLLLTSHYEGTPHAMLEAMAHGLVVLVSRIPGATDRLVVHGVDGFLCDPGFPEDYASILQRLAGRPAEFDAISRAARQTARTRYSADVLAQKYVCLFDRAREERQEPMTPEAELPGAIPEELLVNFPGIFGQCKHRLLDLVRKH